MKTLVFAFAGTIAQTVVADLDADKSIILTSSQTALDLFIARTDFSAYELVLGLGAYSGQDQDALRIEVKCSNHFRNRRISDASIAIPYFLQPAPGIKLADGIGNSWCNLVSYNLLAKSPNVAYTFIHIPKGFDAKTAAHIIKQQLVVLTNS